MRTKMVTEQELLNRQEQLENKRDQYNISENLAPEQRLANAIVERAAFDLAQSIVEMNVDEYRDCMRLFESPYYSILTNLPAEAITDKIVRGANEFIRLADNAYRHEKRSVRNKHGDIKAGTHVGRCPICGNHIYAFDTRLNVKYGKKPDGKQYMSAAVYGVKVYCNRCNVIRRYEEKLVEYDMDGNETSAVDIKAWREKKKDEALMSVRNSQGKMVTRVDFEKARRAAEYVSRQGAPGRSGGN